MRFYNNLIIVAICIIGLKLKTKVENSYFKVIKIFLFLMALILIGQVFFKF